MNLQETHKKHTKILWMYLKSWDHDTHNTPYSKKTTPFEN